MSEGLPEAVVNKSVSRQVIHRMPEPDDIAGSVLILAADQAGWITGQAIMANGGNSFGLCQLSRRRQVTAARPNACETRPARPRANQSIMGCTFSLSQYLTASQRRSCR
jgi:hypothetical protein